MSGVALQWRLLDSKLTSGFFFLFYNLFKVRESRSVYLILVSRVTYNRGKGYNLCAHLWDLNPQPLIVNTMLYLFEAKEHLAAMFCMITVIVIR